MELYEFRLVALEKKVEELEKRCSVLDKENTELKEKIRLPIAMMYGAAGSILFGFLTLLINYIYGNSKK